MFISFPQFIYDLFHVSTLSIFFLAPHFQYIQPERRTFYCIRVYGIFFNCSIAVLRGKSHRCLLKPMVIFLLVLS